MSNKEAPNDLDFSDLNHQVILVYPDIDQIELQKRTTATLWLEYISSKIEDHKTALSLLCRYFGVLCLDATECASSDSMVFFDGGCYCQDTEKTFLRKPEDKVFSEPDKYGLILGVRESGNDNTSTLSKLVSDMYAHLGLANFRNEGVVDVLLKRQVLSVGTPSNRTPVMSMDITQTGSSCARAVDQQWVDDIWAKAIKETVFHIDNGKPGKMVFLCGDYTDGLAKKIIAQSLVMTQKNIVLDSDDCDTTEPAEAVVYDLDELDLKQKNPVQLMDQHDVFSVFVTKSTSIVSLMSKLLKIFSPKELSTYWGRHFFNVSVPGLCHSCKVSVKGNVNFNDEILSITESMEHSHQAGLGCPECINGHRGQIILTEDSSSSRGAIVSSLLSVYKDSAVDDDAEVLKEDDKSPYAFAAVHYKGIDTKNLLVSIKSNLSHGNIQLSDVEGILS